MCKSGTMCCSLRKAIFSKLQIRRYEWENGIERGEEGKVFSVTAQLFGVLRHSSPASRDFSFPAKKRDPGKETNSKA